MECGRSCAQIIICVKNKQNAIIPPNIMESQNVDDMRQGTQLRYLYKGLAEINWDI